MRLALVAAAAWAVGAAYSVWLNPELAFFRRAHELKQEWLAAAPRPGTPRFLFAGGSGTGTSIDPRRLAETHGLAAVNFGLGAGMGARVLTGYALQSARPGDTLILQLETGLLADRVELDPLGVQFSLATGQPQLLRDSGMVDWPGALLDLRPGGYHAFTLCGKVLLRQPLYRYQPEELQEGGWHAVTAIRDFPEVNPGPMRLSSEAQSWLVVLRDQCQRRGIRLAYSFPLLHVEARHVEEHRRHARALAFELARVVPVLRDPDFGANTDRRLFADTPLHPTTEGARLRTDELAARLRSWSIWRVEELVSH